MSEDNEKPEACECCEYPTTVLRAFNGMDPRVKKSRWLCGLCAGTMTGAWDSYPGMYEHQTLQVMKTVCYVGNKMLDAITAVRST